MISRIGLDSLDKAIIQKIKDSPEGITLVDLVNAFPDHKRRKIEYRAETLAQENWVIGITERNRKKFYPKGTGVKR
jgi:hypothetical protein